MENGVVREEDSFQCPGYICLLYTSRMDKEQAKELAMLERVKERLEDGKLAIGFETEDEDEEEYFKNLNPVSYTHLNVV